MVDGGGSLAPHNAFAADERAQRERKARLIAEAWAVSGIDAIALAASDWQLGRPFVEALVAEHKLPVLAANLVCDGRAPYPGTATVVRGGKRVGIVGVTWGDLDGCEVSDPIAAVRDAVAGMDADVTVALVPIGAAALTAFEQADLPVDLVIDGYSGRERHGAEPFGGGWALSVGSRAKKLGVAGLVFVDGAEAFAPSNGVELAEADLRRATQRLEQARNRVAKAKDDAARERYTKQIATYEQQLAEAQAALAAAKQGGGGPKHGLLARLVELDGTIPDHAATQALVDRAKTEIDVSGGGGEQVGRGPRLAPPMSAFAGADRCESCHPAQHAQWSGTPHATAWTSLTREKRALDQECWSCHVTGANQPGGPKQPQQVGGLRDVQCEACHGAAAAHAKDPAGHPIPAEVTVGTCTTCHDGERDMGRFDEKAYWPKVRH